MFCWITILGGALTFTLKIPKAWFASKRTRHASNVRGLANSGDISTKIASAIGGQNVHTTD